MALCKKKRCKLWIWKAIDSYSDKLIDWECGHRDTETLKKMANRLDKWDVLFYFTDKWESYAAIFPENKLIMNKKLTHGIERNNCRNRHWFARFKRKSIVVSKCKEMVDLTMALFARYRVNGDVKEILNPNIIIGYSL